MYRKRFELSSAWHRLASASCCGVIFCFSFASGAGFAASYTSPSQGTVATDGPGGSLTLGDETIEDPEVLEVRQAQARIRSGLAGAEARLEQAGQGPLPPYIKRPPGGNDVEDRHRYQTVYAKKPGAVAAPTAGLHFDDATLAERLRFVQNAAGAVPSPERVRRRQIQGAATSAAKADTLRSGVAASAADEIAGRAAAVESQGKPLQLLKDTPTQAVGDTRGNTGLDIRLERLRAPGGSEYQ